jgi:predicted nucleic acid-binding protein
VIVLDTSVLSHAFRRRPAAVEHPAIRILRDLIERDEPLGMPGVVLQELLSGAREDTEVRRLDRVLESFPLLLASRSDHVTAAVIQNVCRRHGVVTSTIDCLIAAQTMTSRGALFTLDEDFRRIARHCALRLFTGA